MNPANNLISITIPFLDGEAFLADAIESVLAQTCVHWELLLVDDGSIDGGTAIAQRYARQHPGQIMYLEHPGHVNRGLTASRNLGVRHSRGQFLAFLDADDVWLPHKLQEQLALMLHFPEAGMVYGRSEYWFDWDPRNAAAGQNHIPELAPGDRLYHPATLLLDTYPFGPWGSPCPSSFFVRRSVYDAVGGFEEGFNPKTAQVFEDCAFLTKIYLTHPVYVAAACWDKYRRHNRSMYQLVQINRQEDHTRKVFFAWLRSYLRTHCVNDPHVGARTAALGMALLAADTGQSRRFPSPRAAPARAPLLCSAITLFRPAAAGDSPVKSDSQPFAVSHAAQLRFSSAQEKI